MAHFGQINDDDALLSEFIEIIASEIGVYDKRLYNCFLRMDNGQRSILNSLGVKVMGEDKKNISTEENSKKHFLVIHLSFIENLTGKRDTKAVTQFLDSFKGFTDNYRFLIVTTGRGREWFHDLREEFKIKVRYVPIENLERCFDKADKLEPKTPAFGIKYALVKAVLGS